MANFYTELARKILELSQKPMSPKEIFDAAQKAGMIPKRYANAKTPHKTIHARLAESIRSDGLKSPFYRFAAGKFGLRSNLINLDYQRQFAKEYRATIRRKEILNEDVLCIRRGELPIDSLDGFFSVEMYERIIAENPDLLHVARKQAEKDFTLKQIVTYVAIIRDESVLCYERGLYSATGTELIGRKSIGFGGHVDAQDLNLFSEDRNGILSNAWRELGEELNLNERDVLGQGPQVVGLINDNTTREGQKHLAVAMIVRCKTPDNLTKGELEIRNLHWKSLRALPNDLAHFEVWSRIFFEYIFRHLDRLLNAYR
ncbi:HTH domain-containing protein [Bradyrhizobium sp. HKCCYLRH2015]|uniref:HTH domain-containing protein n=1 Tax=Bradyrhizobium sp. HKCCYLRH2015 TaxID=3420742 RepID=UPI003EBE4EEF